MPDKSNYYSMEVIVAWTFSAKNMLRNGYR